MDRRAFLQLLAAPSLGVLASANGSGAAEQDAGLTTRVSIRSEGIPLRKVLQRVSAETGIELKVEGSAGDERLVAFVPGAPLREVMDAVADLYRLEWVRSTKESASFFLRKNEKVASEEAALRRGHYQGLLKQTEDTLRNPPRGQKPDWSAAYPEALPLLLAGLPALERDGSAAFPVSQIPEPNRTRLADGVQPVLDNVRRFFENLEAATNGPRPGLPQLRSGETLSPPSSARDCALYEELQLTAAPEIWTGLRTPASVHIWTRASDDRAAFLGAGLYHSRPLEGGKSPGDRTPDLFDAKVDRAVKDDAPGGYWIGQLARLSDSARVSVYADCYANYLRGTDGHPRARWTVPDHFTPRQLLNQFCARPSGAPDDSPGSSFWWARGNAALIRSSRWLWESETVIPAEASSRLASALRRGRFDQNEIQTLAGLSRFQAQGNGFLMGRSDVWNWAVRAPAHLSSAARQLVLSGGLTSARLSPADREAVAALLPLPGEKEFRYSASIQARAMPLYSQGGTQVFCDIHGGRGFSEGAAVLYVPLSGLDAQLAERGLVVKKLDG